MANSIVTKETFEGYDTDSKLDTIYDVLAGEGGVLERLARLEKRSLVDRGVSAVGGVIGGAVVWIIALIKGAPQV